MKFIIVALLLLVAVHVTGYELNEIPVEGFYDPEPGCVSTSTCCCANGPSHVTAVFSSFNSPSGFALNITGASSGGGGCLFQTTIGGTLNVESEFVAKQIIPAVDISVTARWKNNTNPEYKKFSITTSVTDCPIEFSRHYNDEAPVVSAVTLSISQPEDVNNDNVNVFPGSILTCSYSYFDANGDADRSVVKFVNRNTGVRLASSNNAPHVYTVEQGDVIAGDEIDCVVQPRNNYYIPASSAAFVSSSAVVVQAGASCDREGMFVNEFASYQGDCATPTALHGDACTVSCLYSSATEEVVTTCFNGQNTNVNLIPNCPDPPKCSGVEADTNSIVEGSGCSAGSLPGTTCEISCKYSDETEVLVCGNDGNYSPRTLTCLSCGAESFQCQSGAIINRDPGNDCKFPICPGTTELNCNQDIVLPNTLNHYRTEGFCGPGGNPHSSSCVVSCKYQPQIAAAPATVLCQNGNYWNENSIPSACPSPRDCGAFEDSVASASLTCGNQLHAVSCEASCIYSSTGATRIYVCNDGSYTPATIATGNSPCPGPTGCSGFDNLEASLVGAGCYAQTATHGTVCEIDCTGNEASYVLVCYAGNYIGDSTGSGSLCPASNLRQSEWLGVFQSDSSCVPSTSCCCLDNELLIYADRSNPGAIRLIGKLDGKDGACMGQSDFDQMFDIDATQTSVAEHILRVGTLVVEFKAQMTPAFDQVTFGNSLMECTSVAERTGSSAQLPPEPDLPTDTILNTTIYSANETARLQELWYGTYTSTKDCVPSVECCCTTSAFLVEPYTNQNSTDGLGTSALPKDAILVYMRTSLDGGIACLRRTELAGPCVVIDEKTVICKEASMEFVATRKTEVLFNPATNTNSSTERRIILIENSLYTSECVSKVVETNGGSETGATTAVHTFHISSLFLSFLLSFLLLMSSSPTS